MMVSAAIDTFLVVDCSDVVIVTIILTLLFVSVTLMLLTSLLQLKSKDIVDADDGCQYV
jgi:hypothetical protein